eukprot:76055_1
MSAYQVEETPGGPDDLKQWLNEIDLSGYHKLFISYGYQTFDDLYNEFENYHEDEINEILEDVGIKSWVHRKKFYRAFLKVKQLRSAKDGNPIEFDVSTFHVSCRSDKIEGQNMIGIVLYLCDGKKIFYLNNMKCQSGYILLVSADKLGDIETKQRTMHSKAFKYFIGTDLLDMNIVGSAFAIQDSERKFRSGTFNDATTKFHKGGREMNALEIKCINAAIDNWGKGIQNTKVSEVADESEENDNFLLIKQTMEPVYDDITKTEKKSNINDDEEKEKEKEKEMDLKEWLVQICGAIHGSKYYQYFRCADITFDDLLLAINDRKDLEDLVRDLESYLESDINYQGICVRHKIAIWKAISIIKAQ